MRPTSGDVTLAHVRMHADQMAVPDATVRALIAEQFPRWQALPVRRIASQGTVNAIFRIGDDLAARFPLRPGDAEATRMGRTTLERILADSRTMDE